MGRVKELSIDTRSAIITLNKEGKSERQIASQLKVSKNAVHRALERYRATSSNLSKSRSGRPKVTSSTDDQFIVLSSKRNKRKTPEEIRAELNQRRTKPVSVSTVKRRLKMRIYLDELMYENQCYERPTRKND